LLKIGGESGQSRQSQREPSLKEIAKHTKDQGKTKATVVGQISDYPDTEKSLDQAKNDNTLVVAELTDSRSFPFGESGVRTWYRFQILDVIKENFKPCELCSEVPAAPEQLLPINADEFVLPTGGGTVNVDGVELTMSNPSMPVLETGKKYFLVLRLTPSRVALLGAGPSGIFEVSNDDKLKPITGRNIGMQREIKDHFDTVSKVEAHVNHQ